MVSVVVVDAVDVSNAAVVGVVNDGVVNVDVVTLAADMIVVEVVVVVGTVHDNGENEVRCDCGKAI